MEIICTRCKDPKDEEDFRPDKRHTTTGRASWCRECEREGAKERYHKNKGEKQAWYNRKYRYNISIEEFDERFENQFGLCAICKEKLPEKRKVHVDHSHKTGKVRGLLCKRCNNVLGLIKDKEEIAGNMVDYLLD